MEEPDSANSSFYSTRSAPASQGGPRAASSTQSLARLGSPDDANSALLSLPGYRPTTRSSARRSQAGVSSGAPPGRGQALGQTQGRRPGPFQHVTCPSSPHLSIGALLGSQADVRLDARDADTRGLGCPAAVRSPPGSSSDASCRHLPSWSPRASSVLGLPFRFSGWHSLCL